MESSDEDLVVRIKAGDDSAFQILFKRYYARVYTLAFAIIHSDDALDIVQEAFCKVYRHIDGFDSASSFYTWFYRIVMNLSIDHIRRRQRRREQYVDFDSVFPGQESCVAIGGEALMPSIFGQNPAETLARKETLRGINSALYKLSDNHRDVLSMRELEGLSYQEMADALNCPKGTVMSRLFRARRAMQELLKDLPTVLD
jgi:RNA polymerase sigma-70 factor (ECF subfamily)